MKTKLDPETIETSFTCALDDTVEAAVKLHMSERELVAQLLECLHKKASRKDVLPVPHKMCEPEAGP
jgi:hypothetical protein